MSKLEEKEFAGVRVKCRHCGYSWTYTGGARRTVCPNCEQHVNVIRDVVEARRDDQVDPLDPLNTPYRPGMTKEEIFDLMVEKMIRKGEKITPEMKRVLETLAEKAAEEGNRRQNEKKDGNDGDNDGEKKE